jgi:uncharacterized membrane protein YhhN
VWSTGDSDLGATVAADYAGRLGEVSGGEGVNGFAWAFFAAALTFAALDWLAVARQLRAPEYVCKPGAAGAFLATALVLDPAHPSTRAWFCLALAWCVAGDIFLVLPRDAFVPGLASFLVAQVCFTIGFAVRVERCALVVGVVVVLAATVPLAWRFVRALRTGGDTALIVPVLAYVGAIGAMVATAIGTTLATAIAGAGLFYVSDALIGETRFVGARTWGPVAVMVTYHLALAGLVVSLAA